MILADKIIDERKKLGWSQEELAEKLGVSRQSVSKWEGAQAVPELSKIVAMSKIFGVSTDYLLKEDLEVLDKENIQISDDYDTVPEKRKVSLTEATEYMEASKKVAIPHAIGAALFVLCPTVLIFFAGYSEKAGSGISENTAAAIGLVTLFLFIIAGVVIFLVTDGITKRFEYIEKEDIETEYGVMGLVKEKASAFEPVYRLYNIFGAVLCICSPIPLIVSALADAEDFISVSMVCVLLIMIATAVFLFTKVSSVWNSYEALLQEGEFGQKTRKANKKLSPFFSSYWAIATVIYMYLSFATNTGWNRSWLVWPIAGVLFVPFRTIVKAILKVED